MRKQLETIISTSILSSVSAAPELSMYFQRFQTTEQIQRLSDLDNAVFHRMYNRIPSSSEALKIRYWRSGYNLPATRSDCIHLAFALRMTLEELNHLLTVRMQEPKLNAFKYDEWVFASYLSHNCYDYEAATKQISRHPALRTGNAPCNLKERLLHYPADASKRLKTTPPPLLMPDAIPDWLDTHEGAFAEAYTEADWLLLSLCYRYLLQIPSDRLMALHITPGQQFAQLRHLLYTDTMDCLAIPSMEDHYRKHIYSRDLSSELNRYFKPGASLSRSSLIRILLLMTMPDIDPASLNAVLLRLGYAPLSPEIHTASGASCDLLLLSLFDLYEPLRTGDLQKDRQSFKQLLKLLDQILCEKLRSMPSGPKGSAEYRQRLSVKDLRIMAFHSLRKELS